MTIRRILLAAFLLVGLLPAIVLTRLAFDRTRSAMQGEIDEVVLLSAEAVSDDFDEMLAERLLNATTWNHLEVMQDLYLGDVDKRLSVFLAEMKRRYGDVYLGLHAVDVHGRVVASSEPGIIGTTRAAPGPWQTAQLPGGQVRLARPQAAREGRRLELRAPIDSAYSPGVLGELVLDVDWKAIERLLDRPADSSREVLVVDRDGLVVAASSGLRAQGLDLGSAAPPWLPRPGNAKTRVIEGAPWMQGKVILGNRSSQGAAGFTGFDWTTILAQSERTAFAPVTRMAWAFGGLLAATVVATIIAAFGVAGVIARPVVALTAFTRDYLKPGTPPEPPDTGPGEIGELQRSFVRLVDDLQQSQDSLLQASRLAALGEITALLAHEVRTPLGILRSSAQMLQGPLPAAESMELLRIVETETERLNRLVGSLLDSARTREPQLAPIDVHALIAHARKLLAARTRERGIQVRTVFDATRAVVDCDDEQITQVLLNLVVNATQVMPGGGNIEIQTSNEGRRLVIDVGDDGPGVPVEDRGRLFEPFVFKREGGIGLGLAVVRKIARGHGGDVTVGESRLGGASFRVWLPLDNPGIKRSNRT